MFVYDQRIKYFTTAEKTKGFVIGKKGRDLLKLSPNSLERAYKILAESINLEQANSDELILSDYMKATDEMFKKGKVEADKFVENYNKVSDLLNKKKEKSKDKDRIEQVIKYIDLIFSKSDATSCENIVGTYKVKFEKSPNDVELLKKIVKILIDKKCNETELYFSVVVALDKAEPTAFSSYGIAKMYYFKKDFEKSKEYYDKAVGMETSDSLKAKYLYETAVVLNEMGKKPAARTKALAAAKLRANYGAPYMLIATLYASSGCATITSPKVSNKLPGISYWVAVDKLIKAKTIDPSITKEADDLIRSYRGRYPNKEKGVWLNIFKGTRVTVGCWINESTKARF